jgi:hypothetical protein
MKASAWPLKTPVEEFENLGTSWTVRNYLYLFVRQGLEVPNGHAKHTSL